MSLLNDKEQDKLEKARRRRVSDYIVALIFLVLGTLIFATRLTFADAYPQYPLQVVIGVIALCGLAIFYFVDALRQGRKINRLERTELFRRVYGGTRTTITLAEGGKRGEERDE